MHYLLKKLGDRLAIGSAHPLISDTFKEWVEVEVKESIDINQILVAYCPELGGKYLTTSPVTALYIISKKETLPQEIRDDLERVVYAPKVKDAIIRTKNSYYVLREGSK